MGVKPLAAVQNFGIGQFGAVLVLLRHFPSLLSAVMFLLVKGGRAPQNSGSGMGLCGVSHAPVTGFLSGNAWCLFGHYRKQQHSGCGPPKQCFGLTNFCIVFFSSVIL